MTSSYLKEFITYLIEQRKVESITDFSHKSDINRQYVYKLLSGSGTVSIKITAKIRAAFKEEWENYNAALSSQKSYKDSILSEPSEQYKNCNNCATKDLIIEQQKTTIRALEESLALYRKAEQSAKKKK